MFGNLRRRGAGPEGPDPDLLSAGGPGGPDAGDGLPIELIQAMAADDQSSTQDILCRLYDMDRQEADWYVQEADKMLGKILPDAEKLRRRIAGGEAGLVPGREIIIRSSRTMIRRGGGAGSGPVEAVTTLVTNRNGLIIYAGEPRTGIGGALEVLRLEDPDLGPVTRSMKDARTPEGRRITVYADHEYSGIAGIYPGITVRHPPRRGSIQESVRRQRARMRSGRGSESEIWHRIRTCRRRGPAEIYEGTPEELGRDMRRVSGLANFQVFCDEKKGRLGGAPDPRAPGR